MQREHVDVYCKSEFKQISKKYPRFGKDFDQAFTLLNHHLCPSKPERPVSPSKLIHLHSTDKYELWKFRVVVTGAGLRSSQWPRLWVGVIPEADLLVPLGLNMHANDYDDNEVERRSLARLSAYYEQLVSN